MTRFILCALFCSLVATQGQAQSTKTFMKSFALDGTSSVTLALDGNAVVSEWSEAFVRVEMTVTLANLDESMLKRLTEAGRYKLESTIEGLNLIVTCPKLANKLPLLAGKVADERVTYRVFVPKGTGTQQQPAAGAAPAPEGKGTPSGASSM